MQQGTLETKFREIKGQIKAEEIKGSGRRQLSFGILVVVIIAVSQPVIDCSRSGT